MPNTDMDARLMHSGMTRIVAFDVKTGAITWRPFDYAQGHEPYCLNLPEIEITLLKVKNKKSP